MLLPLPGLSHDPVTVVAVRVALRHSPWRRRRTSERMYRLMDVHFGAYIAILACLAAVASSEQLWYSSIYGNVKCSVNLLVRPASTADTAAAVKSLYMKAQQTNATVKVRATHE